jgi:hypothetical protein
MATKTSVEPLASHTFCMAADLKEGAEIQEPIRTDIQVLARRIQSVSSSCVAIMSLDLDEEIHRLALQVGQEWACRAGLKICVTSVSVPGLNSAHKITPLDWADRVDLLPSIPGRAVEFSYCDSSASATQRLTRDLRNRFDVVIAVLPSPLTMSDGPSIAREYEKLVLVVKAGVTRRAAVRRAIREIEEVGASVYGIVLYNRRYPVPQWLYGRI